MVQRQVGGIQFTAFKPAIGLIAILRKNRLWELKPVNGFSLISPERFWVFNRFSVLCLVAHVLSPRMNLDVDSWRVHLPLQNGVFYAIRVDLVLYQLMVCWRRRVGIEPTNDCFRAIHAGLKSGAPTSDASVSVEGNMQKALINVQQGERNHR